MRWRVTCGGAPVYLARGGITFMVDVSRVPMPLAMYPLSLGRSHRIHLKLDDYKALGGYPDHVRPLASIMPAEGRRHVSARPENPWPLAPAKREPGS